MPQEHSALLRQQTGGRGAVKIVALCCTSRRLEPALTLREPASGHTMRQWQSAGACAKTEARLERFRETGRRNLGCADWVEVWSNRLELSERVFRGGC